MIVVCQQPNYFPWLGYLEQCSRADILILLDSVQWIRQGRQHRTRILPHAGSVPAQGGHDFQWLTLPVLGHGHRQKRLRDLEVDPGSRWAKHHWSTLKAVYGRAPRFKDQLEPWLRPWFERAAGYRTMCEVATSSVELCLDIVGVKPQILMSSELPESGTKNERIISLCQAVEADTYYSGLGSRYIDVSKFRANSIRVVWQHLRHPSYKQIRPGFKSHLSFLDALAQAPLDEIRGWFVTGAYNPFESTKDETL